jgi:hypothetical protein
MGATLNYDGPLPVAEVVGYGHFSPGEEKTIDDVTAAQFDCEPCQREGWTVEYTDSKKKRKSADQETVTPARDDSPRGPRTKNGNDNE